MENSFLKEYKLTLDAIYRTNKAIKSGDLDSLMEIFKEIKEINSNEDNITKMLSKNLPRLSTFLEMLNNQDNVISVVNDIFNIIINEDQSLLLKLLNQYDLMEGLEYYIPTNNIMKFLYSPKFLRNISNNVNTTTIFYYLKECNVDMVLSYYNFLNDEKVIDAYEIPDDVLENINDSVFNEIFAKNGIHLDLLYDKVLNGDYSTSYLTTDNLSDNRDNCDGSILRFMDVSDEMINTYKEFSQGGSESYKMGCLISLLPTESLRNCTDQDNWAITLNKFSTYENGDSCNLVSLFDALCDRENPPDNDCLFELYDLYTSCSNMINSLPHILNKYFDLNFNVVKYTSRRVNYYLSNIIKNINANRKYNTFFDKLPNRSFDNEELNAVPREVVLEYFVKHNIELINDNYLEILDLIEYDDNMNLIIEDNTDNVLNSLSTIDYNKCLDLLNKIEYADDMIGNLSSLTLPHNIIKLYNKTIQGKIKCKDKIQTAIKLLNSIVDIGYTSGNEDYGTNIIFDILKNDEINIFKGHTEERSRVPDRRSKEMLCSFILSENYKLDELIQLCSNDEIISKNNDIKQSIMGELVYTLSLL